MKTVALDLSQLERGEFERVDGLGLETRVTVRLVQDGFAVVNLRASPELVLRVESRGGTLLLTAQSSAGGAQRQVQGHKLTPAELHLEVAQKLVELARELKVERPSLASAPEATPPTLDQAATPSTAPAPRPTRHPGDESGWRVRLGAAALLRSGGVDPLAVIAVERATVGLRPVLRAALAPASAQEIRVFELQLQAGAALPFRLHPRLELSAGLLLGGVMHTYAPRAPLETSSGQRFDFLASLPLTLTFRLVRAAFLALELTPGVSTRARSHVEGDQELWRRGSWRGEAGLGAGWTFR